ncbi:MAG: rhodanese-like domain-containing protein [Deltaproteobacteria bacterium]|nr:rhodanese-like domain-containing protein [Deltaproteobacteria bacterium]
MRGIASTDSASNRDQGLLRSLWLASRDAVLIASACALVALVFNFFRADGIALIQRSEYQILVPCPVTEGAVEAIEAEALKPEEPRTLLIDARPSGDYQKWHVAGAINITYDYLEPTEPKKIQSIAASGARRVVVYGDGENPDSGEQLAKEIAGKGIRNVSYVVGGFNELNKSLSSRGEP